MSEDNENWIRCEYCGKKLIKRRENGLFHFKFGILRDENGNATNESPVDIEILGSLKMFCIRETCRELNVINYFPNKVRYIR